MQLNTVMLKIAETAENRKNYELNIAHLKEEDFEHFNQLRALRKQAADNTGLHRKMMDLSRAAHEEKDKAEVSFILLLLCSVWCCVSNYAPQTDGARRVPQGG